MASVIVLASSVNCGASYIGEGMWIEAGVDIGVQVSRSSGSSLSDITLPMIQGSFDGVAWQNMILPLYFTSVGHYVIPGVANYIRYTHGGGGSGTITIKAIQPNFKKVDVNSLPA